MPQTLTEQLSRQQQAETLEKDWATNARWKGIKRGYSPADVVRLRGSFPIEHTLARRGAEVSNSRRVDRVAFFEARDRQRFQADLRCAHKYFHLVCFLQRCLLL